jgi:outer membrane murein-binding lipoprotein Lpp
MEGKERFEVLLEHMDKNIQTVLEGHLSLDFKIDRNHKEAKELNNKTNLKLDLIAQTLAGKIEQVDQKVENNREAIEINRIKIEQVDQKVEINREKIEQLDRKVEINRKKIEEVDVKLSTNLENHEDRIKVLEAIN